jgi:hypothetical protein
LAHFLDSAAIFAIRNELPASRPYYLFQKFALKRLKFNKTLKKQALETLFFCMVIVIFLQKKKIPKRNEIMTSINFSTKSEI